MTSAGSGPWRTCLFGLGKIGLGLGEDRKMAAHFRYATHAQVLSAHPAFSWDAAVDPDPAARNSAAGAKTGLSLSEKGAPDPKRVEVAVLATPPQGRIELLRELPALRAVVCEKPLGATREEAERFVAACRSRGILLQVNLLRRVDRLMNELRAGRLGETIGAAQAVFATYGNGIRNNGVHMVDLARMLCGEFRSVRAVVSRTDHPTVLPGDVDVAFAATIDAGGAAPIPAFFAPLDFSRYRENSLEIWGVAGRVRIDQEGLSNTRYPLRENRGLEGAREVAGDEPTRWEPTLGDALYRLYDNLAETLAGRAGLASPGENALESERIVDAVVGQAIMRVDSSRSTHTT